MFPRKSPLLLAVLLHCFILLSVSGYHTNVDKRQYRSPPQQKQDADPSSLTNISEVSEVQLSPVNVWQTESVAGSGQNQNLIGGGGSTNTNPNFLPPRPPNPEINQRPFQQSQLQPPIERQLLDAEDFKVMLKDLLDRLDHARTYQSNPNPSSSNSGSTNSGSGNSFTSDTGTGAGGAGSIGAPRKAHARHCMLHGLWLSTVAGAAIQLIPEQHENGHTEIHTKIFELPANPYPPLLTSQWTGRGIISPESPTTVTIVFQEHIEPPVMGKPSRGRKIALRAAEPRSKADDNMINDDSAPSPQLPRTAVFVGQCLICHGSAILRGSWVIFPATQTCDPENDGLGRNQRETVQVANPTSQDSMYLLQYY